LLVRGASLSKRIDPLLCQFFVNAAGVLLGGFVEDIGAEAVEDAGDSGRFGAEEFCGGGCEGIEGFSYLGRQYPLEVGGDKFVMDLLPCASAVLCYGSTFSSVLDNPNASRKMGRISWARLRNMRSSLGFCLYLIPASSILRARASSG
jgi:hypothetical protein